MFLRIIKFSILLTIFLILLLALFFNALIISTRASYAKDLSSKENIMSSNTKGVSLYDRNGQLFFLFDGARLKKFTPLETIPKSMQQAVIAAEDQDFYTHPGFSAKAILRSLYKDIQSRELIYGGSTLTQQLVKNTLLNSNKKFLRKFKEMILAYEIEQKYSKDEILEMYLNSIYFGEGAYGIESAAQIYFGKSASDLSIPESALLAGLLPSPSLYSPLNPESTAQSQTRQKFVLEQMAAEKYITEEERKDAENKELNFTSVRDPINYQANHFAFMVRDELIAKYGEETIQNSGFKVKTTIDLEWQEYAEEVTRNHVGKLARNRASNGAAVVLDPKTGEIKAVVGSIDWYNETFGKVNVALRPRQPGSSFKPIIYATAFEKQAITPSTVLKDQPVSYGGTEPGSIPYRPVNYDRRFRGAVLPRRALANSLNVPAVEVLSKVGLEPSLEMAKRLGFTTLQDPSRYGLSLALGSGEVRLLELTGAYATFANKGLRNTPTTILTVEDKYGEIIYSHTPEPQYILGEDVSFLISSILSDKETRKEAFGNALDISRLAAVKTGTSEDYKDSLTVGFTPSLTIGVWVGNNDGSPMDAVAGSLGAAPIWKSLMEKFLDDTPVENFEPPSNISAVNVCRSNGLVLKEATASGYMEYYIKGTEPTGSCYSGPAPRPQTVSLTPTPTQPPAGGPSSETPIPTPTTQPSATPTKSRPSPNPPPTHTTAPTIPSTPHPTQTPTPTISPPTPTATSTISSAPTPT